MSQNVTQDVEKTKTCCTIFFPLENSVVRLYISLFWLYISGTDEI